MLFGLLPSLFLLAVPWETGLSWLSPKWFLGTCYPRKSLSSCPFSRAFPPGERGAQISANLPGEAETCQFYSGNLRPSQSLNREAKLARLSWLLKTRWGLGACLCSRGHPTLTSHTPTPVPGSVLSLSGRFEHKPQVLTTGYLGK